MRSKFYIYEIRKNMLKAAEEGKLIFTDSSYIEALRKDVDNLGEWVNLASTNHIDIKTYFSEHKESRKNPYLKKLYDEYWLEKIREDEAYVDIDESIEEMEIDHGFGGTCPYENPGSFTGGKTIFSEIDF